MAQHPTNDITADEDRAASPGGRPVTPHPIEEFIFRGLQGQRAVDAILARGFSTVPTPGTAADPDGVSAVLAATPGRR